VDTGFVVFNERTYSLLTRLFGELEVSTQESEMSMSISCAGCGVRCAGDLDHQATSTIEESRAVDSGRTPKMAPAWFGEKCAPRTTPRNDGSRESPGFYEGTGSANPLAPIRLDGADSRQNFPSLFEKPKLQSVIAIYLRRHGQR
jgi:hypothetical protein